MIPAFTMRAGEIEIPGGLRLHCLITDIEHKCLPKDKEIIIDVKMEGHNSSPIAPMLEGEMFRSRGIILHPDYEDAESTIRASIEMIRYVDNNSFYGPHIALTCHVTSIQYRRKRWITVRRLWKRIASQIK